jgi:AcrR family transcriptional regulator
MPYRLTERGQLRRDAMRMRILAAARELFASQGYQATTLRQVVEQAGTSIGNCYFYFTDKEALLHALVEEISVEVGAVIDRAVADVPLGPGRLAIAVYVGVTYGLQNPALGRIVFLEAPHARPRTIALAHYVERISRIFEAMPGLTDGLEPQLVAHAWQGSVFQVLEAAATGTLTAPPAVLGRFLARWNLQALGLAPDTIDRALLELDGFVASSAGIGAH